MPAPEERIRGPIENNRMLVLEDQVHPNVQAAKDLGTMEPWTPIHDVRLVLKTSTQQAADLVQFLEQQRDPSSPNYQRWLTPEEYGERFGVSENDLDKLTVWLQSEGFTVDR